MAEEKRRDEFPITRPNDRAAGYLLVWLVALLLLTALVVGYYLLRQYNPFIAQVPEVKESRRLVDAARNRPLTDEEFAHALQLLRGDEKLAQLAVITALQAEAERTPDRRDQIVAALEQTARSADPAVAAAANTVLGRLRPEGAAR